MWAKYVLGLVLLTGALGQDKVKIDLYYESLCPYSIEFIEDQLYPTYQKVKDIMEVSLFPFGNAKYTQTTDGWSFTCQHGPDECTGNMVHACAQKFISDIDTELEFVNCLVNGGHAAHNGVKCANQVGIDWTPIEQCVGSVEGQEALHDVAVIQDKLDPSLYFVPWILVDDTFSEDQVGECQTDLLSVVCSRYTGTPPAACN